MKLHITVSAIILAEQILKSISVNLFLSFPAKKSCSFGDISSQFKRLAQQEVPEQEIRQRDEAKRRAEHK
jgi:hypothetical protein